MTITIRFQHSDTPSFPCAAIVDTPDQKAFCCSCARTWAEAEAEAVAKAKAKLNAGEPPKDKEVIL